MYDSNDFFDKMALHVEGCHDCTMSEFCEEGLAIVREHDPDLFESDLPTVDELEGLG